MVILLIIGSVVAWALEGVLSALGQPVIVPPWSWGLGLALLGALVLSIAWPIRQRLHAASRRELLDPFYATRVVLLAKSTPSLAHCSWELHLVLECSFSRGRW